jgi:hypothetical protein
MGNLYNYPLLSIFLVGICIVFLASEIGDLANGMKAMA